VLAVVAQVAVTAPPTAAPAPKAGTQQPPELELQQEKNGGHLGVPLGGSWHCFWLCCQDILVDRYSGALFFQWRNKHKSEPGHRGYRAHSCPFRIILTSLNLKVLWSDTGKSHPVFLSLYSLLSALFQSLISTLIWEVVKQYNFQTCEISGYSLNSPKYKRKYIERNQL
jgi:hypothetical protein